jgi:putative two-component system response regulator
MIKEWEKNNMIEMSTGNVLVVDDAHDNLRLLSTLLKRGGLVPRPVDSGKKALEAAVVDPPDLVLLDIQMPEMSGFEVCQRFMQDERLQNIPIIFISGRQGTDDKVKAFQAGGVDYVSKPFQEQEVLARVWAHIHLKKLREELLYHNKQLEEKVAKQVEVITASQMATIFALAKLAESRDKGTGQHFERVRIFSKKLALQMRGMGLYKDILTPSFIDNLYQAACLHDIGKVGVPDAILLKPGKVTPEEYEEIKKHSLYGADTLAKVLKHFPENQFLQMGVELARSHHEKWDGTGYPKGLVGKDIPLSGRIIALADYYDALTSIRCYREAFSHEETIQMIYRESGRHFDPDVVKAFRLLDKEFKRIRQEIQD